MTPSQKRFSVCSKREIRNKKITFPKNAFLKNKEFFSIEIVSFLHVFSLFSFIKQKVEYEVMGHKDDLNLKAWFERRSAATSS